MKLVFLNKGAIAFVDDEDFLRVSDHCWHLSNAGYATRTLNGQRPNKELMHRVIMNAKEGDIIDHINGDPLDNQKQNLRFCTHAQNIQNGRPRKNTSSTYKGVTFHKITGKWAAQLKQDGINHYLGVYPSEKEAAAAYDKEARLRFGTFARVNLLER